MVSLGLAAEEHFEAALEAARTRPFPLDAPPTAELDLHYAAEATAR